MNLFKNFIILKNLLKNSDKSRKPKKTNIKFALYLIQKLII